MFRSGSAAFWLLLGLAASAAHSAPAGTSTEGPAERWVVAPGQPNLVRFESKAPAETFEGKTRVVEGTIAFHPEHLEDSVTVDLSVDLASLDTGISLRNQHMRENHLETAIYPKAVFHGRRLLEPSAPTLSPGRKTTFQLEGEFSLHGVTQTVRVPVEAEMVDHSGKLLLHALARFQVKLSDYKIPRPQFLMLRLDEVQRVTVDVLATPETAAGH